MEKSVDIAKEWEKILSPHSYEITQTSKEFYLDLQNSNYVKIMIKYSGIKKGGKIFEAGCGSGKYSVTLATMGYDVTAMDYTDSILKNVNALKQQAEKFFGKLPLKTVKDDLRDLKTKETYDLVFNEGVVEHWLGREERVGVIKQMVKVTRKGGTVAIFLPNGKNPLHPWWELSRFPGYLSAPPMTLYDVKKLSSEMKEAGLSDFYTDGLDVYYFINKWPRLPVLDYPLGFLEKNLPLPKPLREKLGTIIACLGKKP